MTYPIVPTPVDLPTLLASVPDWARKSLLQQVIMRGYFADDPMPAEDLVHDDHAEPSLVTGFLRNGLEYAFDFGYRQDNQAYIFADGRKVYVTHLVIAGESNEWRLVCFLIAPDGLRIVAEHGIEFSKEHNARKAEQWASLTERVASERLQEIVRAFAGTTFGPMVNAFGVASDHEPLELYVGQYMDIVVAAMSFGGPTPQCEFCIIQGHAFLYRERCEGTMDLAEFLASGGQQWVVEYDSRNDTDTEGA